MIKRMQTVKYVQWGHYTIEEVLEEKHFNYGNSQEEGRLH